MAKRLLILLITLCLIAGGAYYFFGAHEKSNINQAALNQPDPAANRLYQILQTAHFIEQGQQNAPHRMYVIFDPNCIFCHALFEASQKQVDTGKLAIRWVPIGVMKRSSPLKVMAILSAASPIDALKQNEAGFNDAQEEGGIPPIVNPGAREIAQFNHNITILKGLINSVPVVVYKNMQDQPRISGGSLLPLQADKASLAKNEQKVDEFIKTVGKSW